MGFSDQERRRFWEDLLAYYRRELEERQSPAMVSMLGFFHGEEQALEDKRLAEGGHVPGDCSRAGTSFVPSGLFVFLEANYPWLL
jgi:hypothetical protein